MTTKPWLSCGRQKRGDAKGQDGAPEVIEGECRPLISDQRLHPAMVVPRAFTPGCLRYRCLVDETSRSALTASPESGVLAKVVDAFEKVMTGVLDSLVTGKASIFAEREQAFSARPSAERQ